MIEYSFSQFIGLYKMILEFCESKNITEKEMFELRVRLHEPLQNGNCSVSIGFPPKSKKGHTKPCRA